MAVQKKNSWEHFLKKYHIEDSWIKAEKIDSNLLKVLNEIEKSYEEYSKNGDAIAQRLLLEILNDKKIKEKIHSARYRIKEIDSLKVKIIKKKSVLSKEVSNEYEREKYRNLDAGNYYKIITDLIGFRIIVRYREQWLDVHKWIFGRFYKGDEYFLKNYTEDYRSSVSEPFLAEKPKIYYRNKQEKAFYEQTGRDLYELTESDEGYNSVHYIINMDGKYIEIQVRTIFDEAWCECTHDIIYKNRNKSKGIRNELQYLSKCLAHQTIAAEAMVNLMYEKAYVKKGRRNGDISAMTEIPLIKTEEAKNTTDEDCNLSSVEKRILRLQEKQADEFDGNVDKLI